MRDHGRVGPGHPMYETGTLILIKLNTLQRTVAAGEEEDVLPVVEDVDPVVESEATVESDSEDEE